MLTSILHSNNGLNYDIQEVNRTLNSGSGVPNISICPFGQQLLAYCNPVDMETASGARFKI